MEKISPMAVGVTSISDLLRYRVVDYILLSFIILIQSSAISMSSTESKNLADVKSVSESQNQFTLDLYLHLAKKSEGNLFFSATSIATALAMVHMGSKGNTSDQIKSVMHFPDDKSSISRGFKELISEYKKDNPEYILKTSNLAYVSHLLSMLDEFSKSLTEDFLSSSKLVDFSKAEEVRREINKAVEEETNSKIKDLIPTGVLNSLTRLVLVNAIYFKGFWSHKFDKNNTKPHPFWVTPETSVNVPMMNIEDTFRYGRLRDLDCTALSMQYKGDRMSMVILLPKKRDGLKELEAKLTSSRLSNLENEMHETKVKVRLPKFKLEETLDLVPILKAMGMPDLFSEEHADLSGISGKRDLFVSAAIHKAFLEVNEEGAEAAAATAVIMQCRSLMISPEFIADHPFIFYIQDDLYRTSLFLGKFAQPSNIDHTKDEL